MGVIEHIESGVSRLFPTGKNSSRESLSPRIDLITRVNSYLKKLDPKIISKQIDGYAVNNPDHKWVSKELNKSVVITFDYSDNNQLKVRLRVCKLDDVVGKIYFDAEYDSVSEAIQGLSVLFSCFSEPTGVVENR